MRDGIGVRFITLDEVRDRVPFSKVHIYRLIEKGAFPPQVEVGPQRVAWVESEVDEWIAERLQRRETADDCSVRDDGRRWPSLPYYVEVLARSMLGADPSADAGAALRQDQQPGGSRRAQPASQAGQLPR